MKLIAKLNKVKVVKLPKPLEQYCDICKEYVDTSYMVSKSQITYYVCTECLFKIVHQAFYATINQIATDVTSPENVKLVISKRIHSKDISLKRD